MKWVEAIAPLSVCSTQLARNDVCHPKLLFNYEIYRVVLFIIKFIIVMMDLKEIIKWFIPCFHILLMGKHKRDMSLIVLCFFLFTYVVAVDASGTSVHYAKNLDSYSSNFNTYKQNEESTELSDNSVGRTFGRPFKKMMAGLIPIIFQVGAASTWAVVAAIVGVKTLLVASLILKLLLVAGAAKLGALFGHKAEGWHGQHGHYQHQPLQKEIHLHIHNGGHDSAHDEHLETSNSPWNREGAKLAQKSDGIFEYPYIAGPQTISTPYGNYLRIDPTVDYSIFSPNQDPQ